MSNQKPSSRNLVPGFAAMVTAAREAKGWSIRELAREAGMSPTGISSIERETRAPSLDVAAKIAAALDIWAWLHDPATQVAMPPAAKKKGK